MIDAQLVRRGGEVALDWVCHRKILGVLRRGAGPDALDDLL
jgi:hypothetical protein